MFCLLSMEVLPGEDNSLVEKMMLADTQLWKGTVSQSSLWLKFEYLMMGIVKPPLFGPPSLKTFIQGTAQQN